MPFSQNLRRLRLERFLSQAELARQCGLHTITISRLEAGRAKPSTRTVRTLARFLAVTPGELATPEEVAEADKGAIRVTDQHLWTSVFTTYSPAGGSIVDEAGRLADGVPPFWRQAGAVTGAFDDDLVCRVRQTVQCAVGQDGVIE